MKVNLKLLNKPHLHCLGWFIVTAPGLGGAGLSLAGAGAGVAGAGLEVRDAMIDFFLLGGSGMKTMGPVAPIMGGCGDEECSPGLWNWKKKRIKKNVIVRF